MSVATEQQLPTGTWNVDPVHSSAGFAVKHMAVATFRGRFEDVEARLDVDENGQTKLAGAVKPTSIVVKDDNLAGHLQSPDFFDTERYPEISFTSTDVRVEGDEVVVVGDFTIKGNTERVEARGEYVGPHEDIAGNTKIGMTLVATIDRTKFGLNWNAPLPKGGFALANDVQLQVELELAKA